MVEGYNHDNHDIFMTKAKIMTFFTRTRAKQESKAARFRGKASKIFGFSSILHAQIHYFQLFSHPLGELKNIFIL